ncbi:Carbohydrate-binding-like fold [Artemisia annua]|uniref:Carbohydrate-binding-like fold n=1 Tax=Artemisia annua TaxID=35608 RepID=A0A2U1P617_ARTAN|nr:Carbohydrate-binding-like fold [Artemisia annua]
MIVEAAVVYLVFSAKRAPSDLPKHRSKIFFGGVGNLGSSVDNEDDKTGDGSRIRMGVLVFHPPRNGPTIWEIGVPDRTAAKFYLPEPNPTLMNQLQEKSQYMGGKTKNEGEGMLVQKEEFSKSRGLESGRTNIGLIVWVVLVLVRKV